MSDLSAAAGARSRHVPVSAPLSGIRLQCRSLRADSSRNENISLVEYKHHNPAPEQDLIGNKVDVKSSEK